MEIGLGCPRDPVRVVLIGGCEHLVQPATGRDLTDAMQQFADEFLSGLGRVDGWLLKSRSPSCGIRDVKVYARAGDEEPLRRGAGLFAAAVLRRFPGAAIEDDERLGDATVRRRFLGKLGSADAGL